MYEKLVGRKDFHQYGDATFIRQVWKAFRQSPTSVASAHVYHAEVAGRCIASAMVLKVGDTAHYDWGAFDYEFRGQRPHF
jgi:hypothetical protein